jgi:2,3-bisphosphoglycerate-independent phosphoglycerate mutase
MAKPPVVLIVLDGWGINMNREGNAISSANAPVYNRISSECPHTKLEASGEAVGLPEGQMGNSEVGHLNLGAGRIVYQDSTRISKAIRDGEFFRNPVLLSAMESARKTNGTLHLMGLLSDGGVHSRLDHIFAMFDLAKAEGVQHVFFHAFLDGRDTPPSSALGYIARLEEHLAKAGIGRIASTMRWTGINDGNAYRKLTRLWYWERAFEKNLQRMPLSKAMKTA